MNWKGKEYDCNDKLMFEREYLKGKIWNGKWKKYNSNGELDLKEKF